MNSEQLRTMNETQLREFKVGFPKSIQEVTSIITALAEREHDYGTCVYAMSIASVATFNHVAGKLGCTSFQASCADMDVLRRTRGMEGPFKLIDANNLLYPQYDVPADVADWIANPEMRKWLKDEAAKLLADAQPPIAREVLTHWKKLAGETL